MRIRVVFKNEKRNSYVPINTNYYLAEALQRINRRYQSFLQTLIPREFRQDLSFDMYTFSQLIIPEREIRGSRLVIQSKEFYWYVSSPFHQYLGLVAREFRNRANLSIGRKRFEIEKIEFLRSPSFNQHGVKFTCLSPISLHRDRHIKLKGRNGINSYVLPDHADFLTSLRDDIRFKYRVVKGENLKQIPVKFSFDKSYLRKRNNKITKLIAIENKHYRTDYVRGFLAPFKMEAEPEILQLIYDTGLGQFTKMGFGMVEWVDNVMRSTKSA